MSVTVFIETTPLGGNRFECIQTLTDSNLNLDERYFIEETDDRMQAAMTNLGKACRWLVDRETLRGAVCIVSDKDGKDTRFGGEHDALFEAVYDQKEYQKNRLKYDLIYGRYVKYLDKIRDLANAYDILFTQNKDALEDVRYNAVPFIPTSETVRPNLSERFTHKTLFYFDTSGTVNTLRCRACTLSIQIQVKDAFRPVTVFGDKGQTKVLRTQAAVVNYFMDWHCDLHKVPRPNKTKRGQANGSRQTGTRQNV